MLWVITKLTDMVRDIIYGILAFVVSVFTDTLSLTSSEFYGYFWKDGVNILSKIQLDIIFPIAVAILLLNMVIQLYRSMFSKKADGEVDEPIPLVIKTIVFLFLSLNWNLLLYGTAGIARDGSTTIDYSQTPCLMNLYEKFWGLLDNTFFSISKIGEAFTNVTVNGTFADQSFIDKMNTLGVTFTTGITFGLIAVIISIVVGAILLWGLISMIVVYITRFVELKIIEILAPLGFSAGGSVTTQEITKKYIRLYISTIVSLFLSAIFLYLYCFLMAATLSWSGDGLLKNIILLFMTLGVKQIFTRLDGYLAQIGLTNISNAPAIPGIFAAPAIMKGVSSAGKMAASMVGGAAGFATGGATGAIAGAKSGGGNVTSMAKDVFNKTAQDHANGNGTKGPLGFAKDYVSNFQDAMVEKQQANAANNAVNGKTTTARQPCQAAETAIKKSSSQPFTASNGQKANTANNGVALMHSNPDGSVDVGNFAFNDDAGGLVDTSNGQVIGPDTIEGMQSSITGGNLPDSNNIAVSTPNKDGSMTTTNYERNPDTGKWENAETGKALTPEELKSVNRTLQSGKAQVAGVSQGNISDFNGSDLSNSVMEAKPDSNGTVHGAFNTANGTVPVQFNEHDNGISATVGGQTYAATGAAAAAVGASAATLHTPKGDVSAQFGDNGKGGMSATVDGKTYDSPEAAAKAVGASSATFHTPNGDMSAQFSDNGKGGTNTTVGGQTYDSPEAAAKAVGATNASVYNGAPSAPAANASLGNGRGGEYKVAQIKESGLNPSNNAKFTKTLDNCATKGPNGTRSVEGMMKTDSGETIPVKYESNGNGGWTATAKGTTYSSPQAAAEATGAKSVDLYGKSKPLNQAINESGNMGNAFMDTAGVTGGRTRSAMPENKDLKVTSVGNGEVQGVYADMNNNVKPFSGTVVQSDFAKKHPDQCVKIESDSGTMHIRLKDGTTDQDTSNYAANTIYNGKEFISKYDNHTTLNEDGQA